MKWGHGEIDTFVGDIWELATQAIVVPIHTDLRPAGTIGVEVRKRLGPSVEKQLTVKSDLTLGQICVTSAGTLACESVIHIAVTTLSTKPTIEILQEALSNSLLHAFHTAMRSVAIPAMFNNPGELTTSAVAHTTVKAAMDHLQKGKHPGRIVMVVPTDYVLKAFETEMNRVSDGRLLT